LILIPWLPNLTPPVCLPNTLFIFMYLAFKHGPDLVRCDVESEELSVDFCVDSRLPHGPRMKYNSVVILNFGRISIEKSCR
jgi:hypothetical protein